MIVAALVIGVAVALGVGLRSRRDVPDPAVPTADPPETPETLATPTPRPATPQPPPAVTAAPAPTPEPSEARRVSRFDLEDVRVDYDRHLSIEGTNYPAILYRLGFRVAGHRDEGCQARLFFVDPRTQQYAKAAWDRYAWIGDDLMVTADFTPPHDDTRFGGLAIAVPLGAFRRPGDYRTELVIVDGLRRVIYRNGNIYGIRIER